MHLREGGRRERLFEVWDDMHDGPVEDATPNLSNQPGTSTPPPDDAGASEEDARQKLQFDLYYVKNHSLFLDFMISLSTVEVVLFGKGAR